MATYPISRVYPSDTRGLAAVDALLAAEGIRRDAHLDYTCAMFDDDRRAIATGSSFGNTLRCMAVAADHQGKCLMNEIVTHLVEVEAERGCFRLFLYTKCAATKFFGNLGFYEVARAEGRAVLMENRRGGFEAWLAELGRTGAGGAGAAGGTSTAGGAGTAGGAVSTGSLGLAEGMRSAAIVMNANPFTNGHLHLVRTAAAAADVVHLFVVSEDASLFPTVVRRRLVREGVATLADEPGLGRIVVHDTGPYLISSATFPSYFLGDEEHVAEGHAALDAAVFCRIARTLGITERFCGEEPTSGVTATYNRVLARELPAAGVRLTVIPRMAKDDKVVSASTVRQLLKEGAIDAVRPLVPPTTYAYLTSSEAEPVLATIRATPDVVHH